MYINGYRYSRATLELLESILNRDSQRGSLTPTTRTIWTSVLVFFMDVTKHFISQIRNESTDVCYLLAAKLHIIVIRWFNEITYSVVAASNFLLLISSGALLSTRRYKEERVGAIMIG